MTAQINLRQGNLIGNHDTKNIFIALVMRVYLQLGVIWDLRVVPHVSPVCLLRRSFPSYIIHPYILLHARVFRFSRGLWVITRASFLLASLPEFRGRFLHLLGQGLQLLLLPLQNPLLLKSLKLEISRLERIVLLKLFLFVVEVAVLQLPAVRILKLIKIPILLQGSHNLGLKRLLEESFQHGQIDLGVRHLMEDVVVPELGTLILLPLLVIPWLLGSFLPLEPLSLYSR